jgi:hypothetical protein
MSHKRKSFVNGLLIVAFAAFSHTTILFASGIGHQWSLDLVSYGFHQRESGNPRYDYTSSAHVAASENVVAVAIGNLSSMSDTGETYGLDARWDVTLLFFDANTGKLRAKGGPWTGGLLFRISSTSQGTFLLHLWNPYSSSGEKQGETLVLVSPSGEQLKKIDLAPAVTDRGQREQNDWGVLISPSRKTLLLVQTHADERHYEIVDANTLDKQSEWDGASGKDPGIIAISDKNLLGARQSAQQDRSNFANREYELFIRTLDGVWNPFRVSSGSWGFLSDNLVAGLQELANPGWKQANAYLLTVVRIDGAVVLSQKVQGKNRALTGGGVIASPDGRHLAGLFDFTSIGWPWRDLDMGPEGAYVYVWSAPNPEPVLETRVSRNFDTNYDLSPDGSWICIADSHTLRVIRIPETKDHRTP